MKECTSCHKIKPLEEFAVRKDRPCGRASRCKQCARSYENQRRIDDGDHIRQIATQSRTRNAEAHKKRSRDWAAANKDRKRRNDARRRNLRMESDPAYKLTITLRGRLSKALRGGYKSGSAVRDLGCSISELKLHLEAQFKEGMTWNNYGRKGWHVDHIKPLASFDLGNRDQFVQACHYTNLQPLWWIDNIRKGSRG